MIKKLTHTFLIFLISIPSFAQLTPEVTSWILTDGSVGYASIPSNVQQVQYSANYVYVSATCIPGYDIGPWPSNPNVPSNQNFVFKITRNPVQNTGTLTAVGLGHVGVWSNGVSIYNSKDGMTYNNAGVWNRNALYYEGISFDSCLGHAAQNGEYHHHVNPKCLYDDTDSLNHSPIIGYAFDGFPIYGAYGYTNTNGTGAIKRMKSSYVLSPATTRASGPAVDATYPAGCFVEDYVYTAGTGDLDVHNGRYCITPDYPSGIYAYFVTLNDTLYPTFPFVLGSTYYGTVGSGNTGPGSGHNTITESVTTYTVTGISAKSDIQFACFPNPVNSDLSIFVASNQGNNLTATILNTLGEVVMKQEYIQPSVSYDFNLSQLSPGIYYLTLENETARSVQKIMVAR
ncbi:MAG: YHYH protein [Cytophagaceae bacterium]